jgi:hypothetical protein
MGEPPADLPPVPYDQPPLTPDPDADPYPDRGTSGDAGLGRPS